MNAFIGYGFNIGFGIFIGFMFYLIGDIFDEKRQTYMDKKYGYNRNLGFIEMMMILLFYSILFLSLVLFGAAIMNYYPSLRIPSTHYREILFLSMFAGVALFKTLFHRWDK